MTINLFSGGDLLGSICGGVVFLIFVAFAGYAWRYGTLRAERDSKDGDKDA